MNSSTHINKIYLKIVRQLLWEADYTIENRSGKAISELLDYEFVLTDPTHCIATIRKPSLTYLSGELAWYFSGSPMLSDIKRYSKFWDGVSDDGRSVNSNYGKLILHDRNTHNWTQFEYAFDNLSRNKDSKKAVLQIYDREHARKSNDNPCTMYLHFFIRENKLHLLVRQRSTDVWFGLPYDVPFFVAIMLAMYRKLQPIHKGLYLGDYRHKSDTLHMYERNRKVLQDVSDMGLNPSNGDGSQEFIGIVVKKVEKWLSRGI